MAAIQFMRCDDRHITTPTLGLRHVLTTKRGDGKKRKSDDDDAVAVDRNTEMKKGEGCKILRLFGADILVPCNGGILGSPASSAASGVKKNSSCCDAVLDPLPLRQYDPKQGIVQKYVAGDGIDGRRPNKKIGGKKRKAAGVSPGGKKQRKPLKKRVCIDLLPKPSLDMFPRIQSILHQQGVMNPEFLYRKYIEESDINKDLNRLLLAKSDELMDVMTEEEKGKMVTEKNGLEVSGFDSHGLDYVLCFKKWNSQGRPILNRSSWRELVNNNNVEEGQMIEIWGGRRWGREEIVLVVSFRRVVQEAGVESNAGSSSYGSSPEK